MKICPIFYFSFSFTLALLFYLFNFSDSFFSFNMQTTYFLLFAIITSAIIGFLFNLFSSKKSNTDYVKLMTFKIIIGYLLVFSDFLLDASTWPMIQFFKSWGRQISYTAIGGKTIHVLAVTYSSYLVLSLFSSLLKKWGKYRFLHFLFFFVFFPLAIFNRAYIVFLSVALFYIFIENKKMTMGFFLKTICFFLVLSYTFGLLGNLRMTGRFFDSSHILEIGRANSFFKSSPFLQPFFWSYIYIASPISNLYYNINSLPEEETLSNFFASSLIPDFIYKRLGITLKSGPALVISNLNVSTIFAKPYVLYGWAGVMTVFAYFISLSSFLCLFSLFLDVDNGIILRAILASICFHTFFVNSITFSGFSFQLVYPFLFYALNSLLKNALYKLS